MSIIFSYLTCTLQQLNNNTIYITMDDEDISVYQLYFQYDMECTNFQKVLYDLSDEMESEKMELDQQLRLITRLIESNPLYYEYEFVCSKMSS